MLENKCAISFQISNKKKNKLKNIFWFWMKKGFIIKFLFFGILYNDKKKHQKFNTFK